ncbi:hypothetical protein GJ496_003370 [Pomphorhynchus laevis]|nr:hypothetical protein GJ496_003370 [Pomphorhynchus laevis]
MIDLNDPELIDSLKYLQVSTQERLKYASMSFDGKNTVWIPDKADGYLEAVIKSTSGNMHTVIVTSTNTEKKVEKDKCEMVNPPKFIKCDDMADMTYLNDATVLDNLRKRYTDMMIYTYSGLFCVTINPYKRLPIYTDKVVNFYRGKKKNEVPPHLFAISDISYNNMLVDRENQSILITGESGAGKTENTKKVIQYFATVGASSDRKKESKDGNLEDRIIAANPLMEAYGNAKTTRNNNSSRFGKFIRIHFGGNGKIAGADIETYLLEKSRVIFQQKQERTYHIFYQLVSQSFPEYHKMLLIEPNAMKYHYMSQGAISVDTIDDAAEMKLTDESIDILKFTKEEKMSIYKCTGAIMHFGNSKWKQRPREEQAEIDGTEECEKVAYLLGIEAADLIKALLKPRIKVGNEYVNKGQNQAQVVYAVGALSKSIYERMFKWMVERINDTLDAKVQRQYFIGVLDIAGFEIFDYNGFEQLCINFTNEKLQQFFNHHMFVLEQEEYKKEGVPWEFIDFGMDLAACIDLIEKPMGILSILEEECIVPKATDQTFVTKLMTNHMGKHPNFGKPKPRKGKAEAHFEVLHYAGAVAYSVDGWLEKNRDPINQSVAGLFAKSKSNLVATLYKDMASDADDKKSGARSKKGTSSMTISLGHKEQLNRLMSNLRLTHPHFVRCIIPNELKASGVIDAELVLHQLHCNGVLEGIRICRKGFPNRMIYSEFKQRYSILAPNVIPKGFVDANKATKNILEEIKLSDELYRLGHTKVFFKSGVLGQLEDMRDSALSKIISLLQGRIRAYYTKIVYRKMLNQKIATEVLQRNIKRYLEFRNWPWWKLYTKVKPLLSVAKQEEEAKKMKEEFDKLKELFAKEEALRKEYEEANSKLIKEQNEMFQQLEQERDSTAAAIERSEKLIVQKADLEGQLKDLEEHLQEEEDALADLSSKKRKVENELDEKLKEIDDLRIKLQKSESDNKNKQSQIQNQKNDIGRQEEINAKLLKDKKKAEEQCAKTAEDLQLQEDKANSLTKLKAKLEQSIDELEDNLEREKRAKTDLDKAKRKLESELKITQSTVDDMSKIKSELDESMKKKDQELSQLSNRLEDEQSMNSSTQKKLRESQAKLEEIEDALEGERQMRSKVEKQRADAVRELEEMGDRLQESGGATVAQVELNKKREAELAKLRRDLDEANMQHETSTTQLRKKHQDAVNEMGEQIDQLNRLKSKLDKERSDLKAKIDELHTQYEHSAKGKIAAEKLARQLEQQLIESNSKYDEMIRQFNDINALKDRLSSDNINLQDQVEELESQISTAQKLKQIIQAQLQDAQRQVEEELRSRNAMSAQLRNVTSDLENTKESLDEEQEARSELQKSISKLNTEIQQWRTRYETEGMARAEELEEAKRKLAAKLNEAEEQVESALSKCSQLEKVKQRLQGEVEDLMIDVERANANASNMEKKQKQFDKLIGEWKQKCEDITIELESSQKEARHLSTELFKIKTQYDDTLQQMDSLKRDNRSLSDEIKDISEQMTEEMKNIHEVEKARKRAELEKEELQSALEEAEGALEQEEAKVVRVQMELSTVRQEIDRRLQEKEEEFDATRRNHQRAMESVTASLEAENRAKQEALRQKKKLESDINELEVSLDQANRSLVDYQRIMKRQEDQIKEMETMLEDERIRLQQACDAAASAERRALLLGGEVEELRITVEQCDKARRSAEMQLSETVEHVGELSSLNANLASQKSQLENTLSSMQADLDEAVSELKASEENHRRAMADAAKLAEELRSEQDHANHLDRIRSGLEQQLKDLHVRIEEAEANAMKASKRIIQKLEEKIISLESSLESINHSYEEAVKNMRKSDRRCKELIFQAEEDKKTQLRLQDLAEKLQSKLKIYKRQVEEAEEVAAMNLAKYRKVTVDLEDAEERADTAETQLTKFRTISRSAASAVRASPARDQAGVGTRDVRSLSRFR